MGRALIEWRWYLEGDKAVKVVTDHAPNTYLPTQTTLSRRQARWSEYQQRVQNAHLALLAWELKVADPVSRAPGLATNSAVDLSQNRWHEWLQQACADPRAVATNCHPSRATDTTGTEPATFGAARATYSGAVDGSERATSGAVPTPEVGRSVGALLAA